MLKRMMSSLINQQITSINVDEYMLDQIISGNTDNMINQDNKIINNDNKIVSNEDGSSDDDSWRLKSALIYRLTRKNIIKLTIYRLELFEKIFLLLFASSQYVNVDISKLLIDNPDKNLDYSILCEKLSNDSNIIFDETISNNNNNNENNSLLILNFKNNLIKSLEKIQPMKLNNNNNDSILSKRLLEYILVIDSNKIPIFVPLIQLEGDYYKNDDNYNDDDNDKF